MRLPGEFFDATNYAPSNTTDATLELLTNLRNTTRALRATPASHHTRDITFLFDATHTVHRCSQRTMGLSECWPVTTNTSSSHSLAARIMCPWIVLDRPMLTRPSRCLRIDRPTDDARCARAAKLLRRDVIVCNSCDIIICDIIICDIIVRNICKHGKWPTWLNTPNLLHNVASTDVAASVRRYIRRRPIKGCWGPGTSWDVRPQTP